MPAHRTSLHPVRRSCETIAFVLALLIGSASFADAQSYHETGRWTHPDSAGADWGHWPIHMVLLPGDETYHSYVLSWFHDDEASGWAGGLWGWNPDLSDNCAAYPDLTLAEVTQPAAPNMNIFCAGHSALGDGSGRILVAGGTEFDTNGLTGVRLFDPVNGWVTEQPTEFPRYYPTNTTLPSGEVLVTNGWQYFHMLTFGGRTTVSTASTARDDIQRLAMTNDSEWDAAVEDPGGVDWPDARADHTAVANIRENTADQDQRRMYVYGGTDENGDVLNDAWRLRRSQYDEHEEKYVWDQVADDWPHRARHGAIFTANNDEMYVFGGVSQGDSVKGDVLRMFEFVGSWPFAQVTTTGDAPDPRYGHAVAYDRAGGRSRMVVFGGRDDAGLVDDDVYILDLNTNTWSQHDISGPTAREGHTLLVDPGKHNRGASESDWGRMILYGGETGSGLDDEIWMLWLDPSDPDEIEWQQVNPSNDPSGATPARTRHSAAWLSPSTQDGGVRRQHGRHRER